MGYNKNFVVKNGLEVATNLIVADATNLRVGIGTTVPKYTLHTQGGIGATFAYVGLGTFENISLTGNVSAGSSLGAAGQYLVNTGIGVTWQNLPSFRSTSTQVATATQAIFGFTYTVGLLDVYINGVKLSGAEYTATDGIQIILAQPCFGGEIVELISYNSVNPGYAFTGIYGVTLKDEGSTVGTSGQITSINFVGTGVTAIATGAAATVYISGSGSQTQWTSYDTGISTTSNVGIGTTNATNTLTVGGNNASIFINDTATSSTATLNHNSITFNGTGSIQQAGTQQYFRAGSSGASSYLFSNYYSGSDHELMFIDTNGGIRVAGNASISGVTTTASFNVGTGGTVVTTTSGGNVGIKSTVPAYTLDVSGNVRVGINTAQGLILTAPNGTKYQLFVDNTGTVKTIAV